MRNESPGGTRLAERDVLAGRVTINPLLREAIRESCLLALAVVESASAPELGTVYEVLYSRRRVNAVMDGEYHVSNFRPGSGGLLYRLPDIQYDLESFRRVDMDDDLIADSVRAITRLETAFYPVAELKARLLSRTRKAEIADTEEIVSIAKSCVERAVWNSWRFDGNDSFEVVMSLRQCILAFLYHLPKIAKRETVGEGVYELEDAFPHEWEKARPILDMEPISVERLEEAMIEWYGLV